jgi:hypothetical protein
VLIVESCAFIYDIIKLLFVKKIVFVFKVFQLLKLVVDDESHVTVTQTYLACKEEPTVILAVESLPFVQVECSREFSLDLFLIVDGLNIKAFDDDSL